MLVPPDWKMQSWWRTEKRVWFLVYTFIYSCANSLQQLLTRTLEYQNLSQCIFFSSVELCRRKNCSERTVVFTFGVTDWATACRTRTERQQKDPPSSPSRPRWPCTTGTRFTSASWIGPSASTPYPERFSRSASSSSTSSTGSPTKCCDTRTSTQTCEPQNQNCLSDTNWRERRQAHLPPRTGALNFVLRGVFRISAWPRAGLLFLRWSDWSTETVPVLSGRETPTWILTSLNECFWKCHF